MSDNLEETRLGEIPDSDEAEVLVAEIADTTIIDNIMDEFIEATQEVLYELIDTSMKGNAVATHVNLTTASDAIIEALFDLKSTLLESLAKHGDDFNEQDVMPVEIGNASNGDGNLRKQVVDEGD
jgi:hypothetical protein